MGKNKMHIRGRDLELEVYYKCYEDPEPSDCQKSTCKWLLSAADTVDSALAAAEEYILHDENADTDDDAIRNIFYYIMPKMIFVPRDQDRKTVALFCEYRFDPEHGLAIVFEDGKYKETGPQDIIL